MGWFFPDSSRLDGILPVDLREGNLILSDALDNLEPFLIQAFGSKKPSRPEIAELLVNKILAPSFRIYTKLEDQIVQFSREAQRVLTDEQERILEETGLDSRKMFLGSAGSGICAGCIWNRQALFEGRPSMRIRSVGAVDHGPPMPA